MLGKTTKKKVLAAITAFAVAMAMVPCGLLAAQTDASAATKTMTLKSSKFQFLNAKKQYKYTTKFSGKVGIDKLYGICAAKNREAIMGSAKYYLRDSSSYCKGNSMAELAYYYGYVKGWKIGQNGGKLSRAFNYVSTDKKTMDRGKAFDFSKTTLQKMVKNADKYTKKHPMPKSFKCYYAVPAKDQSKQPAVIWTTR